MGNYIYTGIYVRRSVTESGPVSAQRGRELRGPLGYPKREAEEVLSGAENKGRPLCL